jgi:hypothetical protein
MKIDKRTVVVVTASTAIGYLGDVLMYSLAKKDDKKGAKFKIEFPKGKEAFQLLAVGFLSGVVIDYAVKKIEVAMQSDTEKKLQALLDAEKAKLAAGQNLNMDPVGIIWNKLAV